MKCDEPFCAGMRTDSEFNHKNRAKIALFLLLFLGVQKAISADMMIVQNIRHDPKGSVSKEWAPMNEIRTIYIKGSKIRIDEKSKMGGLLSVLPYQEKNAYEVFDLAARRLYIVSQKRKQITSVLLDWSNSRDNKVAERKTPVTTLKKTTNMKTINGYKCREYVVVTRTPEILETARYWITEDIAGKEWEAFKGKHSWDYFKPSVAFGPSFQNDPVAKVNGMPISSLIVMTSKDGELTIRAEVQSISNKPISEKTFVLPEEYRINESEH